jgi:hypothetical protein
MTYPRVEIWALRIGLLLIWLGITGSHHSWVSDVGGGILVVSILAGVAKYVQNRQLRAGKR